MSEFVGTIVPSHCGNRIQDPDSEFIECFATTVFLLKAPLTTGFCLAAVTLLSSMHRHLNSHFVTLLETMVLSSSVGLTNGNEKGQ